MRPTWDQLREQVKPFRPAGRILSEEADKISRANRSQRLPVLFRCGHAGTVRLPTGAGGLRRARALANATRRDCPECRGRAREMVSEDARKGARRDTMLTTTTAISCDHCGEPIDSYTFGRRVTEMLCWRCWFALQDAKAAETEAERDRKRQVFERLIEDLRRRLSSARGAVTDCREALHCAQDKVDRLEDALRAKEIELNQC